MKADFQKNVHADNATIKRVISEELENSLLRMTEKKVLAEERMNEAVS